MLNSLKGKLIIPIAGVLLATMVAIVFYVSWATSNLADDLTQERLQVSSNAVTSKLGELRERSELISYAVSTNYMVINNILEWNNGNRDLARTNLINYLTATARDMNVDSFIVRDIDGVVILRLHDINNFGTADGSASGVAAMQGRTTTGFSSTATMDMGLNTTSPVWHDGVIIGNISPLSFLHTNEFVDRFAEIFEAEVTVFGRPGGNVRVATTLTENGQRAIGTSLENPSILEPVLERGLTHSIDIMLFGHNYNTIYYPLTNMNNVPVGMFFIGFSTEHVDSAVRTKRTTLIVMGVVALLASAGIMFWLVNRLLKPLTALTRTVEDVAVGNFNINIDRASVSNDEIGAIALDVYRLVDVVRGMVDEVQKLSYAICKAGDIDYRVDTERYQGGYKEMMLGLNTYTDDYIKEIKMLLEVFTNVNRGNFKLTLPKLPGKKIELNENVDILLANLSDVNNEINSMIETISVKGNLKFQINVSKYQGDWQRIMTGLNEITAAVDKPLTEIRNSMAALDAGQFNTFVNGDYAGDFLAIKNDTNQTIRSMSAYVNEIGDCLTEVSNGNLTRFIRMDFIGDFNKIKTSINNIVNTLHKTMTEINSASTQVLSGAKQIAASAMNLANGAQQQASAVQELNASIDIINQQTQMNAENASGASELSRRSAENANAGNESMKQMLLAMDQIKESSNAISKIIKLISDTTFQTNLLSLNASVEAARAGEHGRGFAVVADEVRNLANKSKQSTETTTDLINESISRVDAGSAIAGQTNESLAVIVKNAADILEIINAISESSKEQAESISQVSLGLAQISSVVQSNSATSEETAASSEELNSQAEILQQLVSFFRL